MLHLQYGHVVADKRVNCDTFCAIVSSIIFPSIIPLSHSPPVYNTSIHVAAALIYPNTMGHLNKRNHLHVSVRRILPVLESVHFLYGVGQHERHEDSLAIFQPLQFPAASSIYILQLSNCILFKRANCRRQVLMYVWPFADDICIRQSGLGVVKIRKAFQATSSARGGGFSPMARQYILSRISYSLVALQANSSCVIPGAIPPSPLGIVVICLDIQFLREQLQIRKLTFEMTYRYLRRIDVVGVDYYLVSNARRQCSGENLQ